jgi:hypothetical protein
MARIEAIRIRNLYENASANGGRDNHTDTKEGTRTGGLSGRSTLVPV